MSFVFRMVWRETRASWARLGFFFLCVGLGVASIVVLRSVVQHVRTTLTREARSLVGADVVIQTQRPWTDELRARINTLTSPAAVTATADVIDTQTMAAPLEGQGSGQVKLVELRGVEEGFPFYGQIDLETGPYSHAFLADRGAVVQPELLSALGVGLGDRIRMAGQTFTIRGVIVRDRTQRGGGIAFGPRVYIDLATLRQTSLLGFGSRASYQMLLRVGRDEDTSPLTTRLREGLRDQLVSVRSWQTLEDRIGDNLTTTENYLSLVGFAVVVLGGLGVWSVTRVIVQQKIRSVAILKCIGASGRQVLGIYLLQILCLAGIGSAVGLALGAVGLALIPAATLAPLGVSSVGVTGSAAAQGLAVGLLVSMLFALVPLLEVRGVKPLLLLRADTTSTARARDWRSWLAGIGTGLVLALVAVWQANSLRAGLYVSGGLVAIAAVLYGASWALIRMTRPLTHSGRFTLRHAAISLARPGNQTRVILMSVGLGCFFIVGVRALQNNLLAEIATQVGESTPDLVLIDIQEDQIASLKAAVAPYLRAPIRVTPLMRGRVVRVDGRRLSLATVDAVREHRQLAREFGLTFRSTLEANERLVSGTFWAGPSNDSDADTEVSVEERTARDAGLAVGDSMQFDIGGAVIRARVTSVRAVEWEDSQSGGFVFVLRPGRAVTRLAHNYVGFAQVHPARAGRGELQRDLVRTHPNISVIDVRDVVASIRDVVDNVTLGITIVGAVMLVGGVLILVGAVAMTKFQRLYETAIYRALGASARLAGAMMAAEYAILGALAGALGSGGGLALSWALATYLFEIRWHANLPLLVMGVLLTTTAVTVVGVAASLDVLLRKPLRTLMSER